MYKESSKKQKNIFWSIVIILLALFIYSITLISIASPFELLIAGLGWAYILLVILGWFDFLGEIFYLRKKGLMNSFAIIAIGGILVANYLNVTLNTARISEALPIAVIPSVIVLAYFFISLVQINKK